MKQRNTRQKRAILNILRNTKSHPTADWVYEQARKEIPNISKGTVYRNLKMLVQSGHVKELKIDKKARRYDGACHNHYHLKCERCGRVYDLDVTLRRELNRWAAAKTGLVINGHNIEFYGLCHACSELERKN